MYYVYVLLSQKDENFYIGFTENIEQRVDEHRSGKNISTKLRRPLSLIYFEGHTSKFDALRRERYFKTTKGKATLKQILKDALSKNGSNFSHSAQNYERDKLYRKT
jgi:putative endonuclease